MVIRCGIVDGGDLRVRWFLVFLKCSWWVCIIKWGFIIKKNINMIVFFCLCLKFILKKESKIFVKNMIMINENGYRFIVLVMIFMGSGYWWVRRVNRAVKE